MSLHSLLVHSLKIYIFVCRQDAGKLLTLYMCSYIIYPLKLVIIWRWFLTDCLARKSNTNWTHIHHTNRLNGIQETSILIGTENKLSYHSLQFPYLGFLILLLKGHGNRNKLTAFMKGDCCNPRSLEWKMECPRQTHRRQKRVHVTLILQTFYNRNVKRSLSKEAWVIALSVWSLLKENITLQCVRLSSFLPFLTTETRCQLNLIINSKQIFLL